MKRTGLVALVAAAFAAAEPAPKTIPGGTGPEQGFGNAEGIGGGDTVDARLVAARTDIGQSFRLLVERPELAEGFCAVDRCPLELSADRCELLAKLDEGQRKSCREFGRSLAAAFGERIDVPFAVTAERLTLRDGEGRTRPVAAQTELGPKGSIRFHRGSLQSASRDDLNALLAHELGHKIVGPDGKALRDGAPVPGFRDGREFLDAVGTAFAVFSAIHRKPVQAPPPLPEKIAAADYCALEGDFLPGLAVDVDGAVTGGGPTPPTATERFRLAEARTTGKTARERWLASVFGKYFARVPSSDEMMVLSVSLSQGAGKSAVLASILSDAEYLNSRRIQTDEDFVGHVYQELLGRPPFSLEIGRAMAALKAEKRSAFVVKLIETNEGVLERQVRDWYGRYLNRAPTSGEITAHVGQMRSGLSWETIEASLLASPEYLALQKIRREVCARATPAPKAPRYERPLRERRF